MDLQLLPIITFFSVLFVASHGALSPEVYWNSVLPNTAMPKAVKDLISPVSAGKGGVHVNTGKGGTNVNIGHGNIGVHTGKGGTNVNIGHGSVGVHTGKGTNVNVGHGSVGVHTGKGTNVGVGKGGVGVQTGKGINHNYAASMAQLRDNIKYYYAASMAQLKDSKNRAVFFLEKDLVPGNSMSLKFPKTDGDATFLARSDAEKIPFSSNKMSEVFELYDVIAESEEGHAMTETVNECEKPTVKGEEKFCATSLESIVDFSTSKLGKNVKAISTEVDKETKLQKYAITGVSKMNGNEAAVCHKLPYPYALFYCHYTHTTRAYAVSLTGADGTKANAVAACHTDTSTWNPRHLAFQVLKVQPGTVPVCHYLPQDNIVWVAN